MEVSFSDLKEKEIINIYDGKKLGHIVDILFDHATGSIQGIVVPGERKLFKKGDDIFIPLGRLKKIGDDVILVTLNFNGVGGQKGNLNSNYNISEKQNRQIYSQNSYRNNTRSAQSDFKGQGQSNNQVRESYIRYKPVNSRKYK